MADEEQIRQIIESFKLLFDRPNEPLITPKGDKKALFQLTEKLVPPEYSNNGVELNDRFGDDATERIPLKTLDRYPQFTVASQLPADADFSLFLPKHQEMATEVIDALLGVPENQLQDFLSTCVFARGNLNPQLFNYCYSVALMHRKDTKNVPIQNFAETFPSKFMDSQVFQQARETAAVIPQNVPRTPIIIPRDYTATDLEEEHRLAYFREDIGVNLHHWHWHLVYPFTASQRAIVAKDRRGELFFYMHQQLIARYNGERLNNSLKRVKKFSNWREPIPEAYFPKLDSLTSSRGWPPRQANMQWQDLNRPVDGLNVTINDMERWRRNIEEAISTGTVTNADGTTSPLDIDILGNMLEASILSPNRELYGSIHNNGHSFSAYIHDPTHRYLESFGVIADEATTMRDPFFFRWHAWIDDICQKHKESSYVRPYTRSELENPGVSVTSVSVETQGGQPNTLNTFWMSSDVDLSRGLDFSDRGPVYARFTHLNNRPFRYVINVNNTGMARRTTVRIFIAPKFDERNLAWALSDHRKMFIEMDRFVVPLNAGQNTITRLSTESSVTIPFEQTFRDLSVQSNDPRRPNLAEFNFCGCGWPQHMLVPKGTEAGAAYQLFVMLSNYDLDSVEQPDGSQLSCVEASSFCGLKDRKYPDRRAMGFPFDRPSSTATNIEDFILPNMGLQDITIRLSNTTEPNPRNPRTN
ncbi:phenoloxidase 1 [Helicoverpa armigera]|uniref:tyrosinase n=2 Tax=Neoptera TaxID=33340 RepID=Q2VIY6_HELAM|nr:phenoloxidase 1 [Helicoverpa armigera]AAZ52554.1 prophenoloxidase subunit 2 [Helicoverpa armigera]ABU98653.1 prophenoloxidase [Helicoverpa armigera]ATD13327.1 prophenoloxidase 2 [Helicoverpa armigera]